MTTPAYCKNCIWSETEEGSSWNLTCANPKVNIKDAWALSSAKLKGKDCRTERELKWYRFPACGMVGSEFVARKRALLTS